MTRVIAGQAGGRRLQVPAGRTTRPTGDRVREAMFAAAGSILGEFDGARVQVHRAGDDVQVFTRALNNVTNARFRRLRIIFLQCLHHVHHENLARERRAFGERE